MVKDEARRCLTFGVAILLSGCATTPPPFSDDACGARPGQEQVDAAVKTYIASAEWKDPDSVHVRNATLVCRARWIGVGVFARDRTVAWEVDVEINAKNSYGGYTGFQVHSITPSGKFISNDQ